MIDIKLEKPISLSDLPPEAIPGRNGRAVHYVTLSLWHRRGVRGQVGNASDRQPQMHLH